MLLDDLAFAAADRRSTLSYNLAGSYILASNTSNIVEFNMPAYLGLYPSF